MSGAGMRSPGWSQAVQADKILYITRQHAVETYLMCGIQLNSILQSRDRAVKETLDSTNSHHAVFTCRHRAVKTYEQCSTVPRDTVRYMGRTMQLKYAQCSTVRHNAAQDAFCS